MKKKAILTPRAVNLGGRTLVTRGKSKAALQKVMEENKRKKKERQGFRLIDESDVEEMDLVGGDEDDKEE